MEAVPRLPLISFDLKVSPENAHFGPKLKQYIAEAYREDAESYNNEIHQLEGLRSAAVRPSTDITGCAALKRYFCQLRSLQSRFPMAKGHPAAVTFAWRDLYVSLVCSLADIRFEMACVLYNIGALHTQLGAAESRTSSDSMKSACTHYQIAAWAFQYLREHYPQPAGVDLAIETMKLLQEICFAQAQECILEKSMQDTRKPSIVGAVAMQVLVFYRNALILLGPSTGQETLHETIGSKLYNTLHKNLSFKIAYIHCIVNLYQGMHAEEQQKMGERVAYFQAAADKLNEARKLSKNVDCAEAVNECITFTNDFVEGKRKAAKNENEFIYHEEIPDKDLLSDPKPACLVKGIAINFNDIEVSGHDIFTRLVPMGAHEAASMYSEEKAKLLRSVVAMAETKNTEITEFMSSLQLDQLDIVNYEQRLPQELVDRCAAMNAKTEVIQTLVDSMNNLAEIISEVETMLTEIKELIQDENNKEKEYQKIMGPRPPSIVSTDLSREANKYQEAHNKTNESNQVLHKAMTLHLANLRILALPLDELEQKIPCVDRIEGLDRAAMAEMKKVVDKAKEMQTQREMLISQLRDAVNADDITSQLLARAGEPQDDIFKQEIKKHSQKVKIIEQNLSAQENIINKLTSLYAAYADSRRLVSEVMRKRDGLINGLITSYDTHEDLLSKSQKGLEFYRKLSNNVAHLLTRIKSTCQVQEEEREQHLSKQVKKSQVAISSSKKVYDAPTVPESTTPKLKDYLPYMKNHKSNKNHKSRHVDKASSDMISNDPMYPPSIRPAPVGSEANTESPNTVYTDGYPTKDNQYSDISAMSNQMYPNNQTGYNYMGTGSESYTNYGVDGRNMQYYAGQYSQAPPSSQPSIDSTYVYPDGQNFSQSQVLPSNHNLNYPTPQYNPSHSGTIYVADAGNVGYNPDNVPKQYSYTNVQPQQNYITPQATFQYTGVDDKSALPIHKYGENMSSYSETQKPLNDITSQMKQMHIGSSNSVASSSNTLSYQNVPSYNPATNMYTYPSSVDYSQTYYNPNQYPQCNMTNIATYCNTNHSTETMSTQSQIQPGYGFPCKNTEETVLPSSSYDMASYSPIMYNSMGPATDVGTSMSYGPPMPVQHHNQDYSSTSQAGPALSYVETLSNSTVSSDLPSSSYVNTQNPIGLSEQSTVGVSTQSIAPEMLNYQSKHQEVLDQPIKSHVTGQALSSNINTYPQAVFQNLPADPNTINYGTPSVNSDANTSQYASYQVTSIGNADGLPSSYQNHPGYSFNNETGLYDYSYGYQNTISSKDQSNNNQSGNQTLDRANIYSHAGAYGTVQSSSNDTINIKTVSQSPANQAQQFIQENSSSYNNQPADETLSQDSHSSHPMSSSSNENYYSTVECDTNNLNSKQETEIQTDGVNLAQQQAQPTSNENLENTSQTTKQLNAIDLLSDIDFSVEQQPLMPEIKVPSVSEHVIRRPLMNVKEQVPELTPALDAIEEIQRPAKRDLFSDPGLLNKFTEQVKLLQRLVDGLTNKTQSGITLLDSKWKNLNDTQLKENSRRFKNIAIQNGNKNVVSQVVPYDDTRVILKSDTHAYINASYCKQLAPWCIPLIISGLPRENDHSVFWRSILDYKVACIVCLLSEIELQGNCYWPTAKGQVMDIDNQFQVLLEEVNCNVHWTERRIVISSGKSKHVVTHYQINVFPSKVVCSPLVLLIDKVLSLTYSDKLSNQLSTVWIHCNTGSGRSSLIALVTMVMCQVRAGQINLCDVLDSSCLYLYRHRTNVLEDTKFLADTYRTSLYYVQGVLCSGTTLFNGEAVSVPSGASVHLPPIQQSNQTKDKINKFSKESFEEMKQTAGLKTGDMKDPLSFLDPLWSLKKK